MSEIETPSWVQVGQPVAIYSTRGTRGSARITTVARLTATQIVTAIGTRYRRDSLREVGDGYSSELRAPADPWVTDALARQQVDHLRFLIDQAMRPGAKNATEARGMLDAIEEIVAKTRHALDQIEGPQW